MFNEHRTATASFIPDNEMMNPMTFREKSAWAGLLTTVAIYCPYFVYVFGQFARGTPATVSISGAFILAVFVQMVLMIAIQMIFSLQGKPEGKDERDSVIEARSFRYAYITLAAGTWMAAGSALSWAGMYATVPGNHHTPMLMLQAFLLAFVLAEATKYLVQITSYRRGR